MMRNLMPSSPQNLNQTRRSSEIKRVHRTSFFLKPFDTKKREIKIVSYTIFDITRFNSECTVGYNRTRKGHVVAVLPKCISNPNEDTAGEWSQVWNL